MADEQGFMSKVAQGFSDALSNPETPSTCPTCGKPHDDVPGPNKKAAADFQKGMESQPDYIAKLKAAVGIE